MRIIDVMLKEEGRLFFCTARGKDFYKELLANSTVAVTGLNDKWQTVHLMGRAERLADAEQHAMIDRIFEENPSMNEVYPGDTYYILEAFVIAEGSIEVFDLGQSPICCESLVLEKASVTEKDFFYHGGLYWLRYVCKSLPAAVLRGRGLPKCALLPENSR